MEAKKLDFLWDYLKISDNNWDKLTNAVLSDIFGGNILAPIADNSWRCKVIILLLIAKLALLGVKSCK